MKTIDDNKRDEIMSRVIDAPETLTPEDIQLIQEDKELNELYNVAVLCKDASMAGKVEIPDVDAELAEFKARRKNIVPLYKRWNVLMRVATIFTGVAVSTLVVAGVMEYNGITLFPKIDNADKDIEEYVADVSTSSVVGTIESQEEIVNEKELIYDDVTLEEIMNELAEIYKVKVEFDNDDVKSLRLYVKIEQGKTVSEVVNLLGGFENFDISINVNCVTIK